MHGIDATSFMNLIPKYKSGQGNLRQFANKALSQYFSTLPDFEDIENFNSILEEIEFNKTFDKEDKIKYLLFKFQYYWETANFKKAIECLDNVGLKNENFVLPVCHIFYLNSKAIVCHYYLEFEKAIEQSKEALKKFKEVDLNVRRIAAFKILIVGNISSYYLEIGRYDEAFKYYKRAVKIGEKKKNLKNLKFITSNIIIYFIHIKEYKIVKDAYQLLKKIAKQENDPKLYVIKALADLDIAFYIEKNFDKVEKLIEINKSKFQESKSSFYKTNFTIYRIELSIYKNKLREAYNNCLVLNKKILKEDSITYNFDLLLYLFIISTKDEVYLNKIINETDFKRFELNGQFQNLIDKLKEECLKHKSSKIYCYNMLFEYYKSIGEYNKALTYASDNIKQLQDPSFSKIKNKLKMLVAQYEASKKIKLKNELIEKQKQLTRFYKEFAHSAAMELKSPLYSIMELANLMKDALNNTDKAEAEACINVINLTGKKMLLFVEQLLKQQNKLLMQPIKKATFKDIVYSIEKNLKKKYPRESFILKHNTNCKAIEINSNVLKLILKNITTFCIQNKRPNKQSLIHIKQLNKNLFSIASNDKILPKQLIENIFNPFCIYDEYKIQSNIELAICKKILSNYGGEIWIQSKTNEGNSYYFSIMQ